MTTLDERVAHYDQLIPPVYPDKFPEGFVLRPTDWVLTPEVINRPDIEMDVHGQKQMVRPIGTMDVEFLGDGLVVRAREGRIDIVKDYPCGLKCPGCFSEEGIFGDSARLMYSDEVMQHIDSARTFGLTSIKFLGPGELFQNHDLFTILDECEKRKLPISIFTKGAELGSDALAQENYGDRGIRSAKQLVTRVASYDCVRILLGFNSFFANRQDALVGSAGVTQDYSLTSDRHGVTGFSSRGVTNYTQKRDRALQLLVEAGFNDPAKGQRLTVIATPTLKNQIDEMPSIYAWAARRNMPLIIAPSMEAGPKAMKLMQIQQVQAKEHDWVKDLCVAIYSRAIAEGITTLDRIRADGASAYIGIEGCNQVSNGLFLRLNGQVKLCPGTSYDKDVFGNVHDTPLLDLWMQSPNYARGRQQNNWCQAKTQGLPARLQHEIIEELERRA